jgi:hypothetical protein
MAVTQNLLQARNWRFVPSLFKNSNDQINHEMQRTFFYYCTKPTGDRPSTTHFQLERIHTVNACLYQYIDTLKRERLVWA